VASNRGDNGSVNGTNVPDEDLLRANTYALLANLLRTCPDDQSLIELYDLQSDDGEIGEAVEALVGAAREATPEAVDDEYHDLFIGVGVAELTPYASYYLTGFVYEKPLAKLRLEMARLGIAKADDVGEPEDHIAALLEMMCGLITGAFGAPAEVARQRAFFDDHIAPWAARFFEDLETSSSATFYKPVGTIGKLFMRVESEAFQMAA
jgi:TorA maturation chaperone TorD